MKTFLSFLAAAIFAVAVLSLLDFASKARASNEPEIQQRNFENALLLNLAREADMIVIGRVLAAHSYWSADRTIILTDYMIQTSENLKNQAPGSFTLTAEGGVVGEIGLEVSDEVKLERNAAYALFLKNHAGRLVVLRGELGAGQIDPTNPIHHQYIKKLKAAIQSLVKEQKHENQ